MVSSSIPSSIFPELLSAQHASRIRVLLVVLAVVFSLGKRSEQNVRLFIDTDKADDRLHRAVKHLELDSFRVPVLFSSSLAQLALLVLGSRLQTPVVPDRTDTLSVSGGENVFLEWFFPPGFDFNAKDTPVLVYVPGITGVKREGQAFVRRVTRERGWIAVFFHRRGHLQPLKAPEFNIFGKSQDLERAVEAIAETLPGHPIALVGNSAGCAVVGRYLGENNSHGHVKCAVVLSPGYDIFNLEKIQGSLIDKFLLFRLKQFFVRRNAEVLRERNHQAALSLERVRSVHEFSRVACSFASAEEELSFDEWWSETCPLRVADGIDVPLLCLNALDDPICLGGAVESIGTKLPFENRHCAVVVTSGGSHCAHQSFSRGNFFPENWGHTLALSFVEGVMGAE